MKHFYVSICQRMLCIPRHTKSNRYKYEPFQWFYLFFWVFPACIPEKMGLLLAIVKIITHSGGISMMFTELKPAALRNIAVKTIACNNE